MFRCLLFPDACSEINKDEEYRNRNVNQLQTHCMHLSQCLQGLYQAAPQTLHYPTTPAPFAEKQTVTSVVLSSLADS